MTFTGDIFMKCRYSLKFFLLFFMVFVCSGCGKKTSASYDLALSMTRTDTSYYAAMLNDISRAADKAKLSLTYRCADNSLQEQINDIYTLMEKHPKYLIIQPVKTIGLGKAVQEAARRGIKIICIDGNIRDTDFSSPLTSIMPDYYAEGKLCADSLALLFPTRKVSVLEIQDSPGTTAATEKARGFRDELCHYDNLSIGTVIHGDTSRNNTSQQLRACLNQGIRFDAVFAHSDEQGIGALTALQNLDAASLVVPIISSNGQQEVKMAISDLQYYGTIYHSPEIGNILTGLIQDDQNKKTVPASVTIPSVLYTNDNINTLQDY